MGTAREAGTDIPHADAEHPRPGDGPHGPGDGVPPAGSLPVAVEQQILDERQPHAKHPLADGKAVCAGCVGDGAVWRQYAGGQVRVRPGKVGLEPFQVVVLPDKLDRDITEDGICPEDLLQGGGLLRGEAVRKRRHGGAQAGLQFIGQR